MSAHKGHKVKSWVVPLTKWAALAWNKPMYMYEYLSRTVLDYKQDFKTSRLAQKIPEALSKMSENRQLCHFHGIALIEMITQLRTTKMEASPYWGVKLTGQVLVASRMTSRRSITGTSVSNTIFFQNKIIFMWIRLKV